VKLTPLLDGKLESTRRKRAMCPNAFTYISGRVGLVAPELAVEVTESERDCVTTISRASVRMKERLMANGQFVRS